MNYFGDTVTNLIEELSRLPGVGTRSAARMAFHILKMPKERRLALAEAISDAGDAKLCALCCNFSDGEKCFVCADENRDRATIMVVERPRDMAAYEKTREFKGVYHILHGALSPMGGIGPNELKLKELLERASADDVTEVILATNPNIEGEATAMYIAKLLKPFGIKITRIANGVPVGGDLEYIDQVTLSRALAGRRVL